MGLVFISPWKLLLQVLIRSASARHFRVTTTYVFMEKQKYLLFRSKCTLSGAMIPMPLSCMLYQSFQLFCPYLVCYSNLSYSFALILYAIAIFPIILPLSCMLSNLSYYFAPIFIAPACSRVRYRRPIFRPSVRPSVCQHLCRSLTFMSELVF